MKRRRILAFALTRSSFVPFSPAVQVICYWTHLLSTRMVFSRPYVGLAAGVAAFLGVCAAFQGLPRTSTSPALSRSTIIRRFAGPKSARSTDGHMPVVHFVTSNKQKLREVQALLAEGKLDVPFRLEALDVTLPELQDDPTVIAIEKARLAARHVGGPVLVEDTSLCFTALNDLPGPYIKWFLEGLGNQGLFNLLAPYDDKTAFAACNVAFSAGPDDEPVVFCGKTYGTIVAPDGDAGFGWDGIFKPAGFDVTFARMTLQEKNAISHRSLALRQFQEYIRSVNTFSSSSSASMASSR